MLSYTTNAFKGLLGIISIVIISIVVTNSTLNYCATRGGKFLFLGMWVLPNKNSQYMPDLITASLE